MAGRGPAPAAERRRTNEDPIPRTTVEQTGELHGPALKGDQWPAVTLAWWETWRRSAQAAVFTDTDWDFLADTAVLHRAYHEGDLKQAAELRLRVAKFGATPEDRARLRLEIKPPDSPRATPAGVTNLADRRERLSGAS